MAKTEGYSIWIIPTGEAYCRLCMSISNIGSTCSTPSFEPHLTLAGGIKGDEKEVSVKAEKLASDLQPFRIKLDGAGHSSEKFRAVYLNVEENELISGAIDAAAKEFGEGCRPNYAPQVGLLYGDVSEKTKLDMMAKFVRYRDLAFIVERLYLWRTDNGPEDWKEIADYELG